MTATLRPPIRDIPAPKAPSAVTREVAAGVRVVALRRPSVPLVEVRIALPMTAGEISSPADSLVLSESLLSGTADHDRSDLASAVERLGGSIGVHVDRDAIVLGASALASNLRALLALIAEVFSRATFPTSEVASDRTRLADEIAIALSRPETIADEVFDEALYPGHPYAARIPRPGVVRRVSAPALRDLYPKALSARDGRVVVVGDVDAKAVPNLVEEIFGSWIARAKRRSTKLAAIHPGEAGPLWLRDRPGAVQSNLRIGGLAPGRKSADWPATVLAILATGGMFTSRLVTNLRERNGYTYSPRLRVRHGRAGSVTTFGAEVATEVTAASLVETRYELGRVATVGIDQDELDAARRYAIGSFLYSTATQAGLASTLARLLIDDVGADYLGSYPARLSRVTLDQVNDAACRYLAPSKLVTIVVGDAEEITTPLSVIDDNVRRV
jgi:zinc protease